VLIASCASTKSGSTEKVNVKEIPSFYLKPPQSKDTIYGVGEARLSTLTLSRTTALSRARDDVARQVQTAVKNAVTDYAQQSGEGKNQQTIQFVETVSRQVANVTLSGVRTDRIEVSNDGTVYALVSYPVANILQTAQTEFQRNEASAFAEFKADQALKQLNAEIENNPPKAGTTTKDGR
jgi:hypothetical protein